MPIFPKIQLSDETAKPVVSALLEIFSPATELIGWAGDAVRIHRARSALKCFSRTKQIAAEAGLVLKAPPVKFLSQYIENCSLEDETDNELIEWWARMLVDAGIKYESKHVFYANVLKQLGTTEVELLEILVRNCTGNYLLRFVGEAQFVSDFNFPGEGLALSNKFSEILIRQSIKKIRSTFERPGVLILNIFVDDDRSRQWEEFHPDYNDDELASWQILQSLQLVRLDYRRFVTDNVEYRIRIATMTELGAEFYFSCHEIDFDKRSSGEVRFKRTSKKKRAAAKT